VHYFRISAKLGIISFIKRQGKTEIMNNIAEIKAGIIAVSRDCFPIELSHNRRKKVVAAYRSKQIKVTEIETIIENDSDVVKALNEIKSKGINALIIYLGNFGPEGPLSLLAQKAGMPVMVCAAGEETKDDLIGGRGDAYCGMLSASYNLKLRNVNAYIPDYPIGDPGYIAVMIAEFLEIARVINSVRRLKIFSFGPRPQDFLTCHAPIKPLFDLGIEIMENSELDLYDIFQKSKNDPAVKTVEKDMAKQLGKNNTYPDLLKKLAQYEVALTNFYSDNLGASEFGIFANKCWPAFESYFGFVPCFVNSRLAARGIPVACEADIYGALSEYIAATATLSPPMILDINNNAPSDLMEGNKNKVKGYKSTDLFMGFHCGNVSGSCLASQSMKYQLIMHRLLETGKKPNITRGTLEGQIKPGQMTMFRIQSDPLAQIKAYMAEGEILDVKLKSFGSIGVFAISEMGRFYRHVLLAEGFPHHTAIVFGQAGKTIFNALKLMGVKDIYFNLPKNTYYKGENPF
jgi:L-fucose isomerase-like protein